MRQAGRTSPEYRKVRETLSFLELCKTPEVCTEMAMLARDRLQADAAIVFSDILCIVEPMGLPLDYRAGDGPCIDRPVRTSTDVDALIECDGAEALPFVMEAVRQLRSALPPDIPLIGFAGAPFTLASYMIEGGHSRDFSTTKCFMHADPGAWHALMQKIVRITAGYLNAQIASGVQAVQIFDSWVGHLSPDDYRQYVLPHTRELFLSIPAGVPAIHFATLTGTLLDAIGETGADAVSIDFRTPLSTAWDLAGVRSIQGNLDPCSLLAPLEIVLAHADRVLAAEAGRPGHIMNLGGGLLPSTPFDHAIAFVEHVHERTSR